MKNSDKSDCGFADQVRDYVFDEVVPNERPSVEAHLASCAECSSEVGRLRVTAAALRILPDHDVPQRIVFAGEPAPAGAGWLNGFWNSAARLGFASACVLTAGLCAVAWNKPASEVRTVVQTAAVSQPELDAAVTKAVALAVDKVRSEEAKMTQTALEAVETRYEEKQRNLMVAFQTNAEFLQKRYQQSARLQYSDAPGAGQ